MEQSSSQHAQLEFKPRLYRLWTALVGLFFGGCSFGIHLGLFSGPLKNQPLVLHFASGFLLVVFVLAMASAPYSKAACILSEQGVALPEPIVLDGDYTFVGGGVESLLFLPFMLLFILFGMVFMPAYSKPIEWESIQSARFEKKSLELVWYWISVGKRGKWVGPWRIQRAFRMQCFTMRHLKIRCLN